MSNHAQDTLENSSTPIISRSTSHIACFWSLECQTAGTLYWAWKFSDRMLCIMKKKQDHEKKNTLTNLPCFPSPFTTLSVQLFIALYSTTSPLIAIMSIFSEDLLVVLGCWRWVHSPVYLGPWPWSEFSLVWLHWVCQRWLGYLGSAISSFSSSFSILSTGVWQRD